MYEQFTDLARKAMILSKKKAIESESRCVRSGHLLLAILDVEAAVEGNALLAIKLLEECGVNLEVLQDTVTEYLDTVQYANELEDFNSRDYRDKCTFMSLAVSRTISQSIVQAQLLRHDYVGTEHLLLAILQATPDSFGMDNIDYEIALAKVRELCEINDDGPVEANLTNDELQLIVGELETRAEMGFKNSQQIQLWIGGLRASIIKYTTLLNDVQGVLALDTTAEEQVKKIKAIMDSL